MSEALSRPPTTGRLSSIKFEEVLVENKTATNISGRRHLLLKIVVRSIKLSGRIHLNFTICFQLDNEKVKP